MAHYAYIDENNIVVTVIVGKDETELIDGLDTETYYARNTPYRVKRTSYNALVNGFRKNPAAIGYYYDEDRDAFIPPKPYASWLLDESTCRWIPPLKRPNGYFMWNEENQSWDPVDDPQS